MARVWLAVCAVVLVTLGGLNLAHALRRIPPAPRHAPTVPLDAVERHEQRFARARTALRVHHVRGTLGYVADLPPEQMRGDDGAMQELFLTQFALAPAVLEADAAKCAWAVTNLHTAKPAERMPPGFRVVEDFGAGVLLLRKENP